MSGPEAPRSGPIPPFLGGVIAPGYEAVAEAFARNFEERDELGAAFAAFRDGLPVVDLWGGIADGLSRRPWRQDTVQVLFSGTKALVGVCLLKLLEAGRLDLEHPVYRIWPEFAAAGKREITIADVVSHRGRLPGVLVPIELEDLTEPRRMARLLAGQRPLTPAGAVCYHKFTFGWLCGELIRRIDGRSLGEFFAQEIAQPLGLELWIGLPEEDEGRVARLETAPGWGADRERGDLQDDQRGLFELVNANPPLFDVASFPWNRRDFHAAEIGAAGAIGTARSMARLFACLAMGGEIDGVRILRETTVRIGRARLSAGFDPLEGVPLAFGVGFELQTEASPLGPPPDAFGHGGVGGSAHGAWPSERVGFSYAMNRLRDDEGEESRAAALLAALHRAIPRRVASAQMSRS